LKTFAAHDVFGTLALTAITAQNTTQVQDVFVLSPDLVAAQIACIVEDFRLAAVKTGMLGNESIIDCITACARNGQLPGLVVDPVMVSSTGAVLLDAGAVHAYHRLFSFAKVATPNLPEAEALLGEKVQSVADMIKAAKAIHDFGVDVVVIKGGHLKGKDALDVVFDGHEVVELHHDKIETSNIHGTGCTFSAAIAANLALGKPPLIAITEAKRYVTRAIASSADWNLGAGFGPIDHFFHESG
jgi:hydroxymethylpyrimidine/phosphomethylpyrimidine kinase